MLYYRYGKLRTGDLGVYWFVCAILFLLGSVAITLSIIDFLPCEVVLIGAFLIAISFIFFFHTFIKIQERFFIDNSVLSTWKLGKKRDICLPPDLTIIIAYADFMPPLATRSPSALHMRQTIALNDRLEVVLLEDSSEEIMPLLASYCYSSSHIKEAFECRLIYSFVCNQEILNKLICCSTCNICLW